MEMPSLFETIVRYAYLIVLNVYIHLYIVRFIEYLGENYDIPSRKELIKMKEKYHRIKIVRLCTLFTILFIYEFY
jgi:hypothetical protein